MKNSILLLCVLILGACANQRKIIDKPIIFDEERKALTLQYLSDRYGLEQEEPTIVPKMIVLHWTVIPTLQTTFEIFDQVTLPGRIDLKNISTLNVSSQFVVDRDGSIYQLMPETTMGRHVIGLNHCAIGIENVGGTDALPLTKKQLKANIWLVKYLKEKYDIDYLIGHYEYTLFEDHELWLEKDDGYRTEKEDPGVEFMQQVRDATKRLGFKTIRNKR